MGWLAEEAVRRYVRLHPASGNVLSSPNTKPRVLEVRKTGGCVLLDPEDNVVDVLDDNDFINVRLENDVPDANATVGPAMSHFDHSLDFSNKPDAVNQQSSHSEVKLDGHHLTVKDLVLLSKGQTKIRLRKIAEDRVTAGRQVVEAILKENKVNRTINT